VKLVETALRGCFEVKPDVSSDDRGSFAKVFHRGEFAAAGLTGDFAECFQSASRKGALRGFHFQRPPADHDKLVYCAAGEVFDAVVDLRRGSPTYGRHAALRLDSKRCNALYIPRGLAHGFQALSEEAVVVYLVTSVHSPAHDDGIRWDSAGVAWPIPRPIVSPRDAAFAALKDFQSPFAEDGRG